MVISVPDFSPIWPHKSLWSGSCVLLVSPSSLTPSFLYFWLSEFPEPIVYFPSALELGISLRNSDLPGWKSAFGNQNWGRAVLVALCSHCLLGRSCQ